MTTKTRDMNEYHAKLVMGVAPHVPKREIVIFVKGDESEEDYDLAICLPAGVVAGLVVGLHDACSKMDAQIQDKAAVMQPINLTGADAANPIMGHCGILLRAGGFHLPAMLSKEAALQIVDALKEAVESLDRPHSVPKQLS